MKMKFCPKLITDINFEPNALTPCCNTRGINIPQFQYSGGAIDLNLYAKHVEETLASIQRNESICQGCPELREYEIDEFPAESQFQNISINMHRYFCNCKCVYCHFWKMPDRGFGYDIYPGLESLSQANALSKNCFISWGGGEPSILPSFDKTSEFAMDIGAYQQIHTNCLRLSPAITKILSHSRGNINVSLDSGTPETYQKIKGLDGFGKVVNNLKTYSEHGADNIKLKYIVFEENNNIDEINAFLQTAKSLNVSEIEFSLNFLEVNANKVSKKTLVAAAYLILQAHRIGIKKVVPFFVDDIWLSRIIELMKSC